MVAERLLCKGIEPSVSDILRLLVIPVSLIALKEPRSEPGHLVM